MPNLDIKQQCLDSSECLPSKCPKASAAKSHLLVWKPIIKLSTQLERALKILSKEPSLKSRSVQVRQKNEKGLRG